jgi:hypothetical protein
MRVSNSQEDGDRSRDRSHRGARLRPREGQRTAAECPAGLALRLNTARSMRGPSPSSFWVRRKLGNHPFNSSGCGDVSELDLREPGSTRCAVLPGARTTVRVEFYRLRFEVNSPPLPGLGPLQTRFEMTVTPKAPSLERVEKARRALLCGRAWKG